MMLLLCFFLLSGCATGYVSDSYTTAVERINSEWSALIRPDATPVSDDMAKPEFQKTFQASLCGGKADAPCKDKWLKAFNARLLGHYPKASMEETALWCSGHPVECKFNPAVERAFMASHNSAVEQARKAALQQLETTRCSEVLNAMGGSDRKCY